MDTGAAAHSPAVDQRAVLTLRRSVRILQRWLYLCHRWLGIGSCLLFAMWFASGIVMMYVQFPSLTDGERRKLLPPIATERVLVTPDAAMQTAELRAFPHSLRLEMLGGEPVYRITDWDNRRIAVSAADGRLIEVFEATQALALARRLSPSAAFPEMVGRDQWSVMARYDPLRPFHLVALNDAAGTELYISARTGEIALDTTRIERFWNWLGSIPHWIYFTPLRADAPLWRDVVLWLSGPGIVVAISGLWVGIQRLRLHRYPNGSTSPYRSWAKWHHLSGVVGGLFLLTWIVSGWFSMNPYQWFTNPPLSQAGLAAYAGQTLPSFPVPAIASGTVELRLHWVGGIPLAIAYDHDGKFTSGGLSPEHLTVAAAKLIAGANVTFSQLLTEEDAYWYSHHGKRVLPVLRIGFDDPATTWIYVVPFSGEVLQASSASRRLYRWMFNALHSLDFRLLLAWRPAWDIVVWLLSLAGLAISVSGVVLGIRHLMRIRAKTRGTKRA